MARSHMMELNIGCILQESPVLLGAFLHLCWCISIYSASSRASSLRFRRSLNSSRTAVTPADPNPKPLRAELHTECRDFRTAIMTHHAGLPLRYQNSRVKCLQYGLKSYRLSNDSDRYFSFLLLPVFHGIWPLRRIRWPVPHIHHTTQKLEKSKRGSRMCE